MDDYDSGKARKIDIDEEDNKKYHEDNDPNRIYYVYFLCDDTGQVAYVGRTKNIRRRMAAHDKTARGKYHLLAYAEHLTYKGCRFVEQTGIMLFNTLYDPLVHGADRSKYTGNRIRGISDPNHNLAENVKKGYSIMRIIYNEVSNEILNFIA